MILADGRQRLGRLGESAAETYLVRSGMRILARRQRSRLGEIDLIAEHNGLVVFVEVKTRRSTRYGWPAESVTPTRQRRMARAALAFLSRTGRLERACRFDVIEVYADGSAVERVHHIEDAFRPMSPI